MDTCLTCTSTQKKSLMSPDEIIGRGLNRFAGWKCSAGVKTIFIDWLGDIYSATCQIPLGHKMGNIFAGSELRMKNEWMTCNRETCICQNEIELPKFNPKFISSAEQINHENLVSVSPTEISNENLIYISKPYINQEADIQLQWALNRRCNYVCSYCGDDAHNKTDEFKTLSEYQKILVRLFDYFGPDRKIFFTILGGEPTLFADYFNFAAFLKDRGHIVSTVTNFSRTAKYFCELLKVSHLSPSIHFESVNDELIYQKIEAVAQFQIENSIEHVIDIKLMASPESFNRAITLGKRIQKFSKSNRLFFTRIVNLRKKSSPELMDFSDKQIDESVHFNRSQESAF